MGLSELYGLVTYVYLIFIKQCAKKYCNNEVNTLRTYAFHNDKVVIAESCFQKSFQFENKT